MSTHVADGPGHPMRIWSVHPTYLDRQGLLACWRESLLAQAVLAGATKGYQHHPQLERFREQPDPLVAIGAYLAGLHDEATARGYRFDAGRVLRQGGPVRMTVTDGQLALEWRRLGAKLAARSPRDAERWGAAAPAPHPLFTVVPGPVASWERAGEG